MDIVIQFAYVVSAALFILGLKQLGSPATARRGNMISSFGMLLAIVAALLDQGIVDYQWIVIGIIIGGGIVGHDLLVHQLLDAVELVATHRLKMRKIEARALKIDQRAFLLNMVSQHTA